MALSNLQSWSTEFCGARFFCLASAYRSLTWASRATESSHLRCAPTPFAHISDHKSNNSTSILQIRPTYHSSGKWKKFSYSVRRHSLGRDSLLARMDPSAGARCASDGPRIRHRSGKLERNKCCEHEGLPARLSGPRRTPLERELPELHRRGAPISWPLSSRRAAPSQYAIHCHKFCLPNDSALWKCRGSRHVLLCAPLFPRPPGRKSVAFLALWSRKGDSLDYVGCVLRADHFAPRTHSQSLSVQRLASANQLESLVSLLWCWF